MTFPVTITPKALENFRLSREKRGSGAFRLGVAGGGCSGFQYRIEFDDNEPRSSDHVMKDGILEFRVDKKSAVILEGSTLDYIDTGLIGRGFSFRNPQEKSRCGCGVSFQT